MPVTYSKRGRQRSLPQPSSSVVLDVDDSEDDRLDNATTARAGPSRPKVPPPGSSSTSRASKPIAPNDSSRGTLSRSNSLSKSKPVIAARPASKPTLTARPTDVAPSTSKRVSPAKRRRHESSPEKEPVTSSSVGPLPKRRKVGRTIAAEESDTQTDSDSDVKVSKPVVVLTRRNLPSPSRSHTPRESLPKAPTTINHAESDHPRKGTSPRPNRPSQHSSPPRVAQTSPPAKRDASPKRAPVALDQRTPTKSNSSHVFPASQPSTSASSTPKRGKMLSRSATFPDAQAFGTPSSSSQRPTPSPSPTRSLSSLVQKTTSLPSFVPSPTKPRSPSPEPKLPSRPSFRTYSSMRSFLAPLPSASLVAGETDAPAMDNELESQELLTHESYSDLRKKYRIDLSSDDDMDSGISGPDLKTVGELRDKGENRRFLDDMGYLLEGLGPDMSVSVRRLSATKVVCNMADLEYVRRARVCDCLGDAWRAMLGAYDDDKIIGLALVVFLALGSRDTKSVEELSDASAVEILTRHLSISPSMDILRFSDVEAIPPDAKRMGIGKSEVALVSKITEALREAYDRDEDELFTTRRLCSQTLIALNSFGPDVMTAVTTDLLRETDKFASSLESLRLGTNIMTVIPNIPIHDTPDIFHVSNCIRILESSTSTQLGRNSPSDERSIGPRLIANLLNTITTCTIVGRSGSDLASAASSCTMNALRLLVKLANVETEWSSLLAQNSMGLPLLLRLAVYHHSQMDEMKLSQSKDKDTVATHLDIFCLVLALLTSILLESAALRAEMFEPIVSPTCSFGRTCVKACRCRHQVKGTSLLVGLYVAECEKSANEANHEAAFLKGHLAILLGVVCEDMPLAKITELVDILPGDDSSDDVGSDGRARKLDIWVEIIREFAALYSGLARGIARALRSEGADVGDDGDEERVVLDGYEEDEAPTRPTSPSRMGSSTTFGDVDGGGGEKGVELAEKVMRSLLDLKHMLA